MAERRDFNMAENQDDLEKYGQPTELQNKENHISSF